MTNHCTTPVDQERFGGIARLYGAAPMEIIAGMHVCVVGLGGVGSWVVEALARSGVGQLTLIDFDIIKAGNINRQLPALSDTLEQKKFAALARRVELINPACRVHTIDDFLTERNIDDYLAPARDYDYVVDAIDSIKFKACMINHCKRNKIPIITTGGAGGLNDPSRIEVVDLAKTYNDPLASKVRATLRKQYGFSKKPQKSFGVECVFSSQQQVYPRADGTVSPQKPGIHGVSLDCNFGYGSAAFVTGTFGFVAAARVINRTLARRAATERR
ncbi:MAG TPA: tRNA cyclic N6-threonylcarbamoyladenosine(37) synthase TcdA [Anaerolineae bacterium]|nr:tRNA cyclic N6-threonylcarbamoyladenosine(37) synthase TcdA [Anaerolineae bacterium]